MVNAPTHHKHNANGAIQERGSQEHVLHPWPHQNTPGDNQREDDYHQKDLLRWSRKPERACALSAARHGEF